MSLIGNEQAKLTATYLNGLAIALFAVGGLAPVFSGIYSGTITDGHTLAIGSGSCFVASIALHFVARMILRRLRP